MPLSKVYRKFLAGLLFCLIVGFALLLADMWRKRRSEVPARVPRLETGERITHPDQLAETEAVLYFLAVNRKPGSRALLVEERRRVPRSGREIEYARRILEELIAGSREGHLPVLPSATRLQQIYFLADGVAVLHFDRLLIQEQPGGVESETACVYSLINTLAGNLPEIQRAQILVDGGEVETLAGHIDLTGGIKTDLTLVIGRDHPFTPWRVETLPP